VTAAPTRERTPLAQVVAPPANDPRCDVCPHAVADHDPIGLRFCRATAASALVRGCVCQPA
jgi:hypothetical protein